MFNAAVSRTVRQRSMRLVVAARRGSRAWFLHPFLTPKDGMEWGVLKPKSDTLLLCVTFKPLLFLAIVLSSSVRGREMYHIKIRWTQ